eukprot:5718949-Ditylum_brightwellii.AAC.1
MRPNVYCRICNSCCGWLMFILSGDYTSGPVSKAEATFAITSTGMEGCSSATKSEAKGVIPHNIPVSTIMGHLFGTAKV